MESDANEVVGQGRALAPFDAEEFRRYGYQMVDFIADYHRSVESFPVRSQVEPGYLRPLLPDSAPKEPETLEDILSDVQSKIIPGLTHWQSPNFYAYYPSNASTAGHLASMLSDGFNVNGFNWLASPAATELEMIVLDWLGKLLQLPSVFLSTVGHGGGVIQGTTSEAIVSVMIAARKRFVDKLTAQGLSRAAAVSKLVSYTSDQAHSCVEKAAQIAGVDEHLRILPTDSSTSFALSPAVLEKSIAEDVANGLVPFFLCATVGTTSSSAVDPVSALGNVALAHGMWFHVDAAYAGNACICPEFRHHLDGVEKADSYTMNPHKWLLTNFDCSTLWVKDSRSLVLALSTNPEFLRNKATDDKKVVDYKDWQIPLGRRFRSLKLWFVMRMYGSSGLQRYIRNHVALAEHFENLVHRHPSFEVVTPRIFTLICFRLKPNGPNGGDNGNALNKNLMHAVNSTGNMFLTHTVLSGVFVLRMAIGAARTELRHVDGAWLTIQTEAERLLRHQS